MNDLFDSMTEAHAERLAIMQDSKVEKKRGHLAAQRLRDDVRVEWKKRRIEEAGQG